MYGMWIGFCEIKSVEKEYIEDSGFISRILKLHLKYQFQHGVYQRRRGCVLDA